MRYTKYFSSVLKQYGALNLGQEAMQTLLNIVHLESKLVVYHSLNSKHQFGIEIKRITDKLFELTGGLEPKVLMKALYYAEYTKPPKKDNNFGINAWEEHDIYAMDIKKKI